VFALCCLNLALQGIFIMMDKLPAFLNIQISKNRARFEKKLFQFNIR